MAVRAVLRPVLALAGRGDRPQAGRSVAERRSTAARDPLQMRTVTARGPGRVTTTDHRVPVSGGEIGVRTYRPPTGGNGAVHLYLHGGSFWLGSVTDHDPICRYYASAAGVTLVSVDYRLAPEHPYPTGLEDAYAALTWLGRGVDGIEVDPDRITVGGFSAGGGLAAALTLLARDRAGPRIAGQILESPILDLTLSTRSMAELGEGYRLTRASLVEAYGFYLRSPDQAREPYASPLLAPDLRGLPPAYVQTCEFDPLRDEGETYVERLREAGVAARLHRVPGHLHGSVYLTRFLPTARRAVAATADALRHLTATGRLG